MRVYNFAVNSAISLLFRRSHFQKQDGISWAKIQTSRQVDKQPTLTLLQKQSPFPALPIQDGVTTHAMRSR